MKVYLVGGAVRDELLGRKVHDKDYVVVGSSPEEMKAKGFISVGKSFPVFLHPKTKEEYALARKEIKVGEGYKGFNFIFDNTVSLEEDLCRRDFTINAMARSDKEIIDLFNGQEDLRNKTLRHVSQHFSEDPLRVLRGLRFAATLGFNIEATTKELMKNMIENGELTELSSDRIFKELKKVFSSGYTSRFIELLKDYNLCEFIFGSELEEREDRFDLLFFEQLLYVGVEESFFKKYNVSNQFKKIYKYSLAFKNLSFSPESIYEFFKMIRKDEISLASLEKIYQPEKSLIPTLRALRKLKIPPKIILAERIEREKELIKEVFQKEN